MSRTRSLVAALLAACLLGACDDRDPKPDIPDPTSAAPTTPTTATSPVASPSSVLNPEQTAQAWVAAWNDALKSGDTSILRQYESPDCRNCDGLSGLIDDVVSAGGSFSGGVWSIVSSNTVNLNHHRVKVNTAVEVTAGATVNSAGEEPVEFPADKRIVVFELEQSSGIWLIDVIELLS